MSAAQDATPVPTHTLDVLAFRSAKRARDLFVASSGKMPTADAPSRADKLACKTRDEYSIVRDVPAPERPGRKKAGGDAPLALTMGATPTTAGGAAGTAAKGSGLAAGPSNVLAKRPAQGQGKRGGEDASAGDGAGYRNALALRAPTRAKPTWHPHWKLMRVISGHLGWVRSVTVEPGNKWFATGSLDRTIKIWDLASGTLRISLTGHISAIRGLAVSDRHPYLFSAGEDKQVKCWDLEQNKVIRHYHGHLSAVYCMALHPTLSVLMTGGRDSVIRVWDIRSKAQVHCLSGHTNTIGSILTQGVDPQVISGSHDSTIRTWDLAAGKCLSTLTNHKKSVRAMARHPRESTFASAAADNIKQWYLPSGKFIQNCSGHNAILNSIAINTDDVMVAGADNGSLSFWDYRSGYKFQQLDTIPQPGSLESESGIYAMTFDKSYSRLITAEADKTIKIYKEDETSTPETHPVEWSAGDMVKKARF